MDLTSRVARHSWYRWNRIRRRMRDLMRGGNHRPDGKKANLTVIVSAERHVEAVTELGTLHYTTLHYTTLHYTALHYTTLHHTTLHHTTLHYTTPHYTTLHHTTLHDTTLHYTTLQHTAL